MTIQYNNWLNLNQNAIVMLISYKSPWKWDKLTHQLPQCFQGKKVDSAQSKKNKEPNMETLIT